jgi:DNA repair exonuclease SbcCD nuclease subunit
MRFLHAADVHLDAPLKGLEARDGAPVEELRTATRRAFQNLITLALRERVDFVVIAGDLFDGDYSDSRSWVWTAREFQRLAQADIPVFLIRGNHDSLGASTRKLRWPENVHEFRGDQAETKSLERLGVAVHGQSFPTRAVTEDLAAGYPDPVRGAFNIGLLHTSLAGDPRHEPYAPTRPEVLKLKGYDYWALGHIHSFQRVHDDGPVILYPGCTQGRHIHEPGEKGCVIVEVEGRSVRDVVFHALDVVRWERLTIDLGPDDARNDLLERAEQELADLQTASAGRPLAVRVFVRGRCPAHRELVREGGRADLHNHLDAIAHELGGVWIEQVEFGTSPPVDIEQLRNGGDLLGELLRDVQRFQTDGGAELMALAEEALAPLRARVGRELELANLSLSNPEVLRAWLMQAEGLIADAFADTEPAA